MMALSEIAASLRGELSGRDARIAGVSTDTRTLGLGELYIALQGPSFDGHDFLGAARDAGAAGAVVQRQAASAADLPLIRVGDTRRALGELATSWRTRFSIPVVAVTGSNGKTTVKEMAGAIFRARGATHVSAGNLNNDIGVPLVLCGLRPEHQYAVVEMGMNHAGEIAYLTRLARPTVAVINNAAAAHLGGLGSLDAIADAKGEILSGLGAGGVAVLNRDDRYFEHWRRMAARNSTLSFGFDPGANVRASDYVPAEHRFRLWLRDQPVDITLQLPGRHNVANALAAAAAAFAVGLDAAEIRAGLVRVEPVAGRLCPRRGAAGASILDDSYNANPGSVAAGLAVLAERPGKRILVLGDMAELGADAAALHEQVGRQAREAGIDAVYGLGELSRAAVEAFGGAGGHYSRRGALIEALRRQAGPQTTLLVKGSRSMRMDEVAAALDAAAADGEGR